MTFDINHIIILSLGVLGLFIKGKTFKKLYHKFLPIIILIYSLYKGNFNKLSIIYIFYVLLYWIILKNNCFLTINENNKAITKSHNIKKKKIIHMIFYSCILNFIISKFISRFDVIILNLLIINSYLEIYESLHYTNLRYISIFLMYFIFLKYFKDIDLDLRISFIIIYIFYMCFFRKILNEKVKPNTIDKILMFAIPFTTLIEI